MIVRRFFYHAYGLGIGSDWALPELMPGGTQVDVTIRLARTDEELPLEEPADAFPWGEQRSFLRLADDEICLFWEEVGCCVVRQGREIVVQPQVGVAEEVLRLHLLGSALGVVLHQRGLYPFHASAVEVAGQAVLFLGHWGAGKSTLAAALHGCGHRLITDDVAALAVQEHGVYVQPAYPQLKLWPASLAIIGAVDAALPKVHPAFDKRALRVAATFAASPLPIRSIFLLEFGESSAVLPATPTAALFGLLSHWYLARLGDSFTTPQERRTLFQGCADLVRQLPINWLQRTPRLADLPQHVRMVEEYVLG